MAKKRTILKISGLNPPRPSLRVLSVAQIMPVLDQIHGDGHTIFPESILNGWPQELIDSHVEILESNLNDPQQTIFDAATGKPVNQMRGVYGYRLLGALCRDFGVEAEGKLGRGSQARAYDEALRAHFREKANA